MPSSKLDTMTKLLVQLLLGKKFTLREAGQQFAINDINMKNYITDLYELIESLNDDMAVEDDIFVMSPKEPNFKDPHIQYSLVVQDSPFLDINQIFIILESLMANRFLSGDDIAKFKDALLTPFIKGKVTSSLKVNKILERDLNDYEPVNVSPYLEDISLIHNAIIEEKNLTFKYSSASDRSNTYLVSPLYVFIDRFYVYLLAIPIVTKKETSNSPQQVFRIDRMYNLEEEKEEKIKFIKRPENKKGARTFVINANIGPNNSEEMYTIKLLCAARTVEYALDQFPKSRISKAFNAQGKPLSPKDSKNIKNFKTGYKAIITADVHGLTGSINWILSQGANVEVLEPAKLKSEIKSILAKALANYDDSQKEIEDNLKI